MLIENTSPITIPASEEKTYPNFWVSRIIMDTPSPDKGKVIIELKPYNSLTKEILNKPKIINIQNIWEKSQELPQISTAIQAILTAVNAIENLSPENSAQDL